MGMEKCPECNTSVSGNAEYCPKCGNVMEKNVGCVLGLAIIFFPVLFSWFTLQKGYPTKTRVAAFGWLALSLVISFNMFQFKEGSTPAPTETDEVRRYELGESFQLGSFLYKIKGVRTRSIIGNQVHSESPSEGAVFLVVSYTIENTGDETSTVLANDFKIKDSSGRIYTPSNTANSALNVEYDNKEILFSQLQPGIKKEGLTAFEVPEKSIEKPLEFIVPTKKMFSSEKAVIEFVLN